MRRRGAAAIEFALTSIVFFFLLFAIVDWGWLLFRRANLQDAVMEGARAGAAVAPGSTPDPETVAVDGVSKYLLAGGVDPASVTISTAITGSSPQKELVVSATMEHERLIKFTDAVPNTLSATMAMHLEVQ